MKKTTDYIGNFVYEDEGTLELRYFLTQEGRIMANSDGTFEYQYFLKDHLGNTRVTFNQVGEIIQEDSYYPFGMAMKGLNYQNGLDYKNKYLYNGKELQDEFGLRWYDNGARFYDAEIARWHVVDPLAEERNWSSTFCYTQNNPINRIDPNGMLDTKYEDEEGKMLLETNDGSDAVVTVTNDKREGFEAAVKGTEDTDNVVWNKVMKKYFLGFELSSDQETLLTHLSSDWTRKKAIIYWQNENIGNWTKLIIPTGASLSVGLCCAGLVPWLKSSVNKPTSIIHLKKLPLYR